MGWCKKRKIFREVWWLGLDGCIESLGSIGVKHDVIFFPMEKPIQEDLTKFRINWQKRSYCFDILDDETIIDYDQIYLVDGMNILKMGHQMYLN